MEHTNQDSIVISAADFFAYMRCPKSFALGWVRGWSVLTDKPAVINGSAFHLWMEGYALGAKAQHPFDDAPHVYAAIGEDADRLATITAALRVDESGMQSVAEAYIEHRWLPNPPTKILMVEQPLYTKV